jgi:hypothetical protein
MTRVSAQLQAFKIEARNAFNPLDRVELGRSVGRALLLSNCQSLPPERRFLGAGLYAIYYQGDFKPYAPVAFSDCEWPIYVGKAAPKGGRSGLIGLDAEPGADLFSRLREHARSLEAAANLDPADFRCRYLVVDDIWIPLAERLLIGHYQPLWNGTVKGFGNHPPGGKPGGGTSRGDQMKSAWDILHPGRSWAKGRKASVAKRALLESIRIHLEAHPPARGEAPILGEPPTLVPEDDLD